MAFIPSYSDAIVSVPKATKILLWLDIGSWSGAN